MRRVVVVAMIAAAVVACKKRTGGPPAAEERPVAVRVAEVGRHTLQKRIPLVGDVLAVQEADVLAEVGGLVEEMEVYTGDSVGKGDLLAVIEHDRLAAEVAEAEAALAAAKAEAHRAANTRARLERLIKDDLVSDEDLDAARAADEAAKAQVQLAEARLQQARIRLDDAFVKAPFSAVVAKRYVDPGANVGEKQPLLRLVDSSVVKVVVEVDERYLSQVDEGTAAYVTVAGLARPVETSVFRVSPVVDERNRSGEVEIRLRNGEGTFRPGMFARVELVLEEHEDVPAVPVEAILAGSSHVYVAEDGRARLVDVATGLSDGRFVEVTEGLCGSETVVVSNIDSLHDGAPIAVRAAEQ